MTRVCYTVFDVLVTRLVRPLFVPSLRPKYWVVGMGDLSGLDFIIERGPSLKEKDKNGK